MSSSTDPFPPSLEYDAYAHYGRNIILAYHEKLKASMGFPGMPVSTTPVAITERTVVRSTTDTSQHPIGILGAGQ